MQKFLRLWLANFMLLSFLSATASANPPLPEQFVQDFLSRVKASPLPGKKLDSSSQTLRHYMVDTRAFRYRGMPGYLLIAASKPVRDYECHACAPVLSFAIYTFQKGAGWKPALLDIASMKMGAWGDAVGKDEIKTLSLKSNGDDVLAFDVSGTGQGYMENFFHLYAPLGGKMRKILSLQTELDDSGANIVPRQRWSARMKILPTGEPFRDIEVHRHGIESSRKFEETLIYRYQNGKYVKSTVKKKNIQTPGVKNPLIMDDDGIRYAIRWSTPLPGKPFTISMEMSNRTPQTLRAEMAISFPQIRSVAPEVLRNDFQHLAAYVSGSWVYSDYRHRKLMTNAYLVEAKSPAIAPGETKRLESRFQLPASLPTIRFLTHAELLPYDPANPRRHSAPNFEMHWDALGYPAAEIVIPVLPTP